MISVNIDPFGRYLEHTRRPMFYLVLSVLMNVALFIAFGSFSKFKIHTFQAIVINYITCVVTGVIFLQGFDPLLQTNYQTNWVIIAGLLGAIFLGTFYLLGLTIQRLGVNVASIASKMSLIIPVLFSLFFFKIASKPFDLLNYLGISLALIAIILSTIRKPVIGKSKIKATYLILPLGLFLLSGAIDTLINYANFRYLTPVEAPVFPLVIFGVAAFIGMVTLLVQRQRISRRAIIGGIYLGIPNYFSLYFIIKALSAFKHDGAILYPLLNIGIIVFSSLAAVTLFKEKLLPLNKLGLILAVAAILLISHQEISQLLNF